ncbi:hypothetical protein CQW23_03305 [Capsicum baccatum]|uniref:Uncharacterized protein n=1 Tax=Capsicum baccatum TaxID=33114 RepID=A0A2G2XBI3_CAPBA|nr:hypothetical protein CQW23_03305 [Capsicum baccatum]
MEWGIADNASIVAKTQLKVARAKLEAAVSELQFVNSELEAAYLKSKEHLVGVAMEREQDTIYWEKELKEAEEEFVRLNQKILSAKDHKAKLDTASSLLQDLNNKLSAYMESILKQEADKEVNSKGELLKQEK